MNIEASNINQTKETTTKKSNTSNSKEISANFAEELKINKKETEKNGISANKAEKKEEQEQVKLEQIDNKNNPLELNHNLEIQTNSKFFEKQIMTKEDLQINSDFNSLTKETNENQKFSQIEDFTAKKQEPLNINEALNEINLVVKEFNQSEDKLSAVIKKEEVFDDTNDMINKDFRIQNNTDILPQMNPNMNFSGDGQPFSSFMNNSSDQNNNSNGGLSLNAKDLAEEKAILSTMEENIAIANKNQIVQAVKTITNEEGIKKVDSKTGIKIENIVKFDSVIMNQADVEVFANLVENGEADMNNLAPKALEKSIQVSKTLADMLAKANETKQPLRIDFDNNISIIIRISRDGKISGDFLPSSQVAEAYLKENLPLLRQRFDDNNIEYDSLNQKERRNPEKENNKKKGRNNE